MNYATSIFTLTTTIFSLVLCVLFTNTLVSVEQSTPNVPQTLLPKQHAVKITSPIDGKQIPIGKDLTVTGISTPAANKTSHCQVSVIANSVKPYQPAKGTGPGGATDYSTWSFVLSSHYTALKPGSANKITAKYSCSSNPGAVSFYSINITGVAAANSTIIKQQGMNQRVTKTIGDASMVHQRISLTTENNTTNNNSNNNTSTGTAADSTSKTLGYDKLAYLDSSKLSDNTYKSKPIPHDMPFILPFP